MSSPVATIAAAAIIASPAWGSIFLSARRQRKRDERLTEATHEQTAELKNHFTATAGELAGHAALPLRPAPEGTEDDHDLCR